MIDVKELRIGSHIEHDGKRRRIDYINCNGEIGEIYISNPKWSQEVRAEEHSKHNWCCNQVNPIPLTKDLLIELGFESDKAIDGFIAKRIDRNFVCIQFDTDGKMISAGTVNLDAKSGHASRIYGDIGYKYLHQLENFVYLAIGKELIEK